MSKGKKGRVGWDVGLIASIVVVLVVILSMGLFNSYEPVLKTVEAIDDKESSNPTVSSEPVKKKDTTVTSKIQVVKIDLKKEMTEALKSMEKGNYTLASTQWLAIIRKDPKNSDAHAWLAACYGSIIEEVGLFKKMKYNNLMEDSINEAMRLNPDSTLAHMIRGRRYLSAPSNFGGDVKKAIEDFKFCIENGRDDADIYYYLGQSYEANGDRKNALKAYENALKKDPNHAQVKEKLKKLKTN